MTFINKNSFKCLLGPQSKDVNIIDNIFTWKVGKKQHFVIDGDNFDIKLIESIAPSNFHYLSESQLSILKEHFDVSRVKNRSIIIDLRDFSLEGGSMKNVRQSFNKCAKNNFEILDNFKDINDVKLMINEWSNEYTDKYFRDFSGKNFYFYKNNFHKDCLNKFIYYNNNLVAFGTLTNPINNVSTYIIGKALYKKFYGLSEYTDILLYKSAIDLGTDMVNMGQASKGLLFYKTKFKSIEEVHYDGSIKVR